MADAEAGSSKQECPICSVRIPLNEIQDHVNDCLNLSEQTASTNADKEEEAGTPGKRPLSEANGNDSPIEQIAPKKPKTNQSEWSIFRKSPMVGSSHTSKKVATIDILSDDEDDEPKTAAPPPVASTSKPKKKKNICDEAVPLAEIMRPQSIEEYVGQQHITGKNTALRKVLDKNEVPSMILFGPPGCGKTTLAEIIANQSKKCDNIVFIKRTAVMSNVKDIRELVDRAKVDRKFHRKTILFMDEIHSFSKTQQEIFLPHVESGVITLIGATTMEPSFSLNSALLSRCRVIRMEKIIPENMYTILERSLKEFEAVVLDPNEAEADFTKLGYIPKIAIEKESIQWLADMCDGDARIGLNSLQLAMNTVPLDDTSGLKMITKDDIKEGIKKSHILYDRKGDQHYDIISALHKSIRASDDNAALYWCTRMIEGGEDPVYICRRLVRAASEDICNPAMFNLAVNTMMAVKNIGKPESDVMVAQCAVLLARAEKNNEIYMALQSCKKDIKECKGILPSVPLHLRNAPTRLLKEMGCGVGYNMRHKDTSGLHYMPEGMEDVEYFD